MNMDLLHRVMTAALTSKHHVFVRWSPHVRTFSCYALPSNTDYFDPGDHLFESLIYVDGPRADEFLVQLHRDIVNLELEDGK